ncbi:uncharacterized protein B0H64DRAFT_57444 [Chaetomium fimeti]|uniref:LYR motif-containing protein Cup1-like N-terminal domain-containing protein n=1 Tax=Chaetomium fimeti TaxID=1854472 RepID=A0AAE0LM21_9PEZI|nr:hypothetical protein B0H64DRAFT_57444 [Chaetomium fimeti]
MSQPLRMPKPETALHLYRHILREASYLPPIARRPVDKQIKDKFRRNREDEDKITKHLRQANHDLRALRAANAGDMGRMRRVLLRAFGRIGRRRRELISQLVHRDIPTNTEELAKYAAQMADIAERYKTLDWMDEWDLEKLRTLARSQVHADPNNAPKAAITDNQTAPEKNLPKENSWGRPLPRKLARTKLKNMWKALADKVMPPLPVAEWKKLEAIADGTMSGPWLPPPRRPLAQTAPEDAQKSQSWNWQSYAIRPVAVVDRQANRRNKLLSGAVDDNTPTGDPPAIDRHKFTPRTWRRLLSNIWQLSPAMTKKPNGKGWDVTWGGLEKQPPPARASNMEFFRDFPAVEEPTSQRKRGRR